VHAVRRTDEDLRMPPDRALTAGDVDVLVEWVSREAPDPRGEAPLRLGGMTLDEARRWWSFQPLRRPELPEIPSGHSAPRTAIDAFLETRMAEHGRGPAPAADRRTLIRRVTYDLTGLPPTPDEVDAFSCDDSPLAYRRLIDRLLASPAYGERWGRHWLDLVRYADTAGENSDHPVPQAWRYRNWVIDAFNRDLPYDAFLRDQVAGDLVASERGDADPEAVVATGCLAVARRFGHDIDKDMYLTREDVIDTLGKSLLGLSLGCARCHAHKYDPISSEDYYALDGIFASTRFAFPVCEPKQQPRDLVPLLSDSQWQRLIAPYREQLETIDAEQDRHDAELATALNRLDEAASRHTRKLAEGAIDDGGSADFALDDPLQIEAGQMLVLSVGLRGDYGADTTRVTWSIECDGPARNWDMATDLVGDLLAGNPHADGQGHPGVWWLLDPRAGLRPLDVAVRDLSGNRGLNVWRHDDNPSAFVNSTDQPISVWTRLAARSLFVHPAPDGPAALGWVSPVSARVRIHGTIEDAHPGGGDGVSWKLEQIAIDLGGTLDAVARHAERRGELARQRATIEAAQPARALVYGVAEGTPTDSPLLQRGDPEKPGPPAPRRWLEVLGGTPLADPAGSGRRELASWLTDSANPLVPRVLVNRLWQHHFGAGIVRTPNDFGTRGRAPTHPELIDWLATELIASQWQLKPLHRAILLSDAYQRTSLAEESADPENLDLARFSRRRLSFEELRDTLLWLGGSLDRGRGGPHPFPPESAWNFTQHAPFAASYPINRRSIYLMIKRNRREPLSALFDGADPNSTTPERSVTTVPTQALFFLNDAFFHEQAARMADAVLDARAEPQARVDELFRLVLQRAPSASECAWAARFLATYSGTRAGTEVGPIQRNSWHALARVLLGSNEFLYLD
jgi:hypothetical protein